jgi:hypothetical protein
MLNYFQLLYDYFSLIEIISPYIIYGYLWLFSITFAYSKLFLVILTCFNLGYFQLCKFFGLFYVIFGYCRLFQFRLLVVIINYLAILTYFTLRYFQLL